MDTHRTRNFIPPVYAVLILVGFLISASVGIGVVIVGAILSSVAWTTLSRGGSTGRQRDRSRNRGR